MVRLKHRYLLVDFLYPSPAAPPSKSSSALPEVVQFHQPTSDKLTPGLLIKTIRDGVADLFGDHGSGMTSGTLTIKYLSPATSTAIIRVSRDHYRLVWAALSFMTRLPHPINRDCVVRVVRVSGTIRKAEEEAIRQAKQSVLRARQASGDGAMAANALLSKPSGRAMNSGNEPDEDVLMTGVGHDDDGENETGSEV